MTHLRHKKTVKGWNVAHSERVLLATFFKFSFSYSRFSHCFVEYITKGNMPVLKEQLMNKYAKAGDRLIIRISLTALHKTETRPPTHM